jgi:hypothetical protein
MSKTPRTDANAVDPKDYANCFIDDGLDIVTAIFARQLETELAEAKELNRKLVEALEWAMVSIENNQGFGVDLPDNYKPSDVLPKIKKALEAAREEK